MNVQDIYLLCFAIGTLWTLAALFLGGVHFGHFGPGHAGHSPVGHTGHMQVGRLASHAGKEFIRTPRPFAYLLNPICAAIFLARFGWACYLHARHTGLGFWVGTCIAMSI